MNKNKSGGGKININLFNDHAILSKIFADLNKKMNNAIEKFSESLLDFQVAKVHVGYIGNLKLRTGAGNISDFATIILNARTFKIKVEDKSKIQAIIKTVEEARSLTVSKMSDRELDVTIPDPTEEVRERFIKDMKEHGRQYLDQINNIRRDSISAIEKEYKPKEQKKKDNKKKDSDDNSSSGISEDEMKNAKAIVEQIKDKNLDIINSLTTKCEQDIRKAVR